VISLIAESVSNQIFVSELRWSLPVMNTLEQILTEQPTPSSLMVRVVPLSKVIVAVSPAEWPLEGESVTSRGFNVPPTAFNMNVVPSKRTAIDRRGFSRLPFIFFSF